MDRNGGDSVRTARSRSMTSDSDRVWCWSAAANRQCSLVFITNFSQKCDSLSQKHFASVKLTLWRSNVRQWAQSWRRWVILRTDVLRFARAAEQSTATREHSSPIRRSADGRASETSISVFSRIDKVSMFYDWLTTKSAGSCADRVCANSKLAACTPHVLSSIDSRDPISWISTTTITRTIGRRRNTTIRNTNFGGKRPKNGEIRVFWWSGWFELAGE